MSLSISGEDEQAGLCRSSDPLGGGVTAAFLTGEDNFLLHFKIYFYT